MNGNIENTQAVAVESWRGRLALRIVQVLSPITFAALLVIVWSERSQRTLLWAILLSASSVVLGLEALRKRERPLRHAWLVVGVLFMTGTLGYSHNGSMAGPGVTMMAAVMVAGLLLPRGALIAVIALALLAIGTVGVSMVSGWLPPPPAHYTSMRDPRIWARTTTIAFLLIGLIVAMTRQVVRDLERALEHARAEARERERAERERLETQRLAMEAQKLEMLGQLGAGVAHDFNNALMVIQLWNDLLSRPQRNETQVKEGREAIALAVAGAAALARQLLVLGRKEVRAPGRLALGTSVDVFVRTLGRLLPSDIEITVQHEGDGCVVADALQLDQIMLNFALNARDAMPLGGRLTFSTRDQQLTAPVQKIDGLVPPGRYCVLEVADTGTGMNEATRSRAFEAFFSTKGPTKGSGLGLATVLSIAQQNEAHVSLESEIGIGTKLSVWFPRAPSLTVSAAAAKDSARPNLRGMRILLAENSDFVRQSVEHSLVDAGCRVLSAQDGTHALALVQTHDGDFDLLCTDGVMPGTPVSTVIQSFERKHPAARVLVMSGYVDEELARRGIETGRYGLLVKPFGIDQLLLAVAQLCGEQREAASA